MRTIVRLLRSTTGGDFSLLSEAIGPPPGGPNLHPLVCTPQDQEILAFRQDTAGGGLTATVGRKLFDALIANPDLQQELSAALAQQSPIYLNDESPFSQALPWEALCDANGRFVSLEDTLRLARLAGAGQGTLQRTLDRPLRVLAVLAAAGGPPGDTAKREWEALHAALKEQATGLGFTLRILGCDEEVKDAVAAAADPAVSFQFLASADALLDTVESFRPHLLHLFCHGFLDPSPRLELATRGDQELGKVRGSVVLELADFHKVLTRHPAIWLVTLNCCLGAAATATGESQALARQLVREGFPAVVGMQEPIDRADAHLFSGSFYRSLLRHLATIFAAGPPPYDLDWAAAMVEPRQKLARAHSVSLGQAASSKQWTLPILYMRLEPFKIQGVVSAPDQVKTAEIQAEIQQLNLLKADLASKPVPPAALEAIGARISALEQQLGV